MALTKDIVQVTANGETDKRLQISGGAYLRTLKAGSDWNTLRVSMLWSANRNTSWSNPPLFYFGLTSGKSAPPGSPTPNHFAGVVNYSSLSFSTDHLRTGAYFTLIQNGSGTTNTFASSGSSGAVRIMESSAGRSILTLEFVKGTPWTIRGYRSAANLSTDNVTTEMFNNSHQGTTPYGTLNSTTSFTPDESTYGDLDTVCFAWLGENVYEEEVLVENNAFDICDIAVRRLA